MATIDIMYINTLAFTVGTSTNIRFVMTEHVNDISKVTLMGLINKTINLYYKRMFKVITLLMEPEFDPMLDYIYEFQEPTMKTT